MMERKYADYAVEQACALLFHRHCVLDEGCVGDVGRWKPECHVWTFWLFLVSALGFHLSLPIDELLKFRFIMVSEFSQNSLY